MSDKILGIDLGTTNSCIAFFEGDEATVIPNSEGQRTTPSVVAFSKSGELLVGSVAKRQSITNPSNTIHSAKRLIGRKYKEVTSLLDTLSYSVVEGPEGDAYIKVKVNGEDKIISPQEVSSYILAKLKRDAESFLGETVTRAVITVPAYFNDAQRQATKDAGTIAGLDVVRIVNEPTAAALAYGLNKKDASHVAVYDLGGGTFDVSILSLGDGVFEVKATNGDTNLGGDNWDEALMRHLVDIFNTENSMNILSDKMATQRIKEEAEKCKISLSSSQEYEINLPFLTADSTGPKHLIHTVTRSTLEHLSRELLQKTTPPFTKCLRDSKLSIAEIDDVVMVGGMTRAPSVLQTVKELTGKEAHRGVNPDEVVALGAAIQGAVISGSKNNVLLMDVTPLTLGIETAGGIMTGMIPRNTSIPVRKQEIFSTYKDNQTAVDVHILQGERPLVEDNKSLGKFRLEGINPAPRGAPQILVVFEIDANGILQVSASDVETGVSHKVSVRNAGGLSAAEINRIKNEADNQFKSDMQKKELADSKNILDGLLYTAGSHFNGDPTALAELADVRRRLPSMSITEVLNSITDLQSILNEKSQPLKDSDYEVIE